MRRRALGLALPVLLLATACAPPRPQAVPQKPGRYMVGQPYQLGGTWSYPREDFSLRDTGLAAVISDRRGGRETANGEAYDPLLLTAAHRSLQLPAILVVTNLENGLELRVRVNDRGPEQPGRLLALSARAATLLRIPPEGGTQIAIAVDSDQSRALAAALPAAEPPALVINTAPRGAIESESLAPPPGASAAATVRQGRAATAFVTPDAALPSVPQRLPETLVQGYIRPGRLLIQAGSFTSFREAQRQAAQIGARVESFGPARRPEYRVRLGPYNSVAQADAALAGLYRAGLPEARILVD